MNREQKKTVRTFGITPCEWCGKWTTVWKGVTRTEKALKIWHDRFEGRFLQCKRRECIDSRPEDWAEIKYTDPKRVPSNNESNYFVDH